VKVFILLVLLVLLSGCSTLSTVVNKGAEVNDKALIGAETTICQGASVGAVERRYKTDELKESRQVICDNYRMSK